MGPQGADVSDRYGNEYNDNHDGKFREVFSDISGDVKGAFRRGEIYEFLLPCNKGYCDVGVFDLRLYLLPVLLWI